MGRSYTRRSLIEYLFYPLACCRKGTLGHKFLWRVPGAKVRATGGYGKRSSTSAWLLSHTGQGMGLLLPSFSLHLQTRSQGLLSWAIAFSVWPHLGSSWDFDCLVLDPAADSDPGLGLRLLVLVPSLSSLVVVCQSRRSPFCLPLGAILGTVAKELTWARS